MCVCACTCVRVRVCVFVCACTWCDRLIEREFETDAGWKDEERLSQNGRD